jgi:hypothetical protein
VRAEPDVDALLAHLLGEEGGDLVVEAAQQPRAAHELRHLRAEAAEIEAISHAM